MDSAQGFHAIVNLLLIPLWLLSGAMFPLSGASGWIRAIMRANPLTYGNEGLRSALFPGSAAAEFPVSLCLSVLAGFSVLVFFVAFLIANQRSTKPAA